MCDCVSVTRRLLCRDCGADCVDCWEWLRALGIEFCRGFTDEACGELCTHVRRRCRCPAVSCGDCRGAGHALGQCVLGAGRCGCFVFGVVRDIPGFVLGLLMLLATAAAVAWYVAGPPTSLRFPVPLSVSADAVARAKAEFNATVTRLRGLR